MIAHVLVCLHEKSETMMESGNFTPNNVVALSAHSKDIFLCMAMKFDMITSAQVNFGKYEIAM